MNDLDDDNADDGTRLIPLGNSDYCAIVDAEDYAWLSQWRWTFKRSQWKFGGNIYARRHCRVKDPKGGPSRRVTVYMHVLILEKRMGRRKPSAEHTGDHRNTNTLDNTRRNLRWASDSVQSANQRPRITAEEAARYELEAAA